MMHLAIIGTGKMGSGIFQWAADRDIALTLCSRSEENLRQQEGRFVRKLERAFRRGEISAGQAEARRASVKFTTKMADIAGADFALETVPEETWLKKPVLQAMEEAMGPDGLILSNTSSLSLTDLAKSLKRPERFCGLHFFHPIMVVSMIEIITWPGIAPGVTDRLLKLCGVLGRKGMIVADAPGSPLNWILGCLYVEGLYILEEGAALPTQLDQAARRHISPGPCEAIDSLGMELILQVAHMFTVGPDGEGTNWLRTDGVELKPEQAGGREGFHIPWLLKRLIDEKRFGRKSQKGLFVYEGDKTLDDDPSFYLRPGVKPAPLSDDEIALRIFYSVYNASLHAVRRGLFGADDIDYGLHEVLLMKAGPLHEAKSRGLETVRKELDYLVSKYGKRFSPPMALEEVVVT